MEKPGLRVGTSSWSSADWKGVFYPQNARPGDFLTHYAQHFDTVECDATFYHVPAVRTVEGWRAKTPENFLFCAKLPREITHDRGLVDCESDVRSFVSAMERLGPRLGPLVAQFPYIAKGRDAAEYETGDDFRGRLERFLDIWPRDVRLVVEIRNAKWLGPPLLDLLRARGVPLVVSVYYTMPGPEKLFAGPDPVTGDLLYVRFLGDHRRMDALVEKLRDEGRRAGDWSETALDREDDMRRWAEPLRRRAEAGTGVLAYFNNHYAGFAPASVELFVRLWNEFAPR